MTNGPGAVLAEIVENPLPRERARADVHKHPLYYAVRNHIIDFLVSRSKSFSAEAGAAYDPRASRWCGPACRSPRSPSHSRPTTLCQKKEHAMTRADLTEKLLDIKREKGWSWKYICEQIGGMSPVMITGGVLGQQKMTKPMAAAAAKLFGLSKTEQALLNEVPMRGTGTPMPPTDPLIYRFYELVMVNGPAWKALIEEEFGDGIMSAIDFDMTMERQPDPKGDRVKIAHDRQVPAVQVLRRDGECSWRMG